MSPIPTPPKLELCYYYGARGQFPRVKFVCSIEEAEEELQGKHFHSAELFEHGSCEPIKTWERSEVIP